MTKAECAFPRQPKFRRRMLIVLTLTDEDCLREPYQEIWRQSAVVSIDDANNWAIQHLRSYNAVFDNPVKLLMVEVEEEG